MAGWLLVAGAVVAVDIWCVRTGRTTLTQAVHRIHDNPSGALALWALGGMAAYHLLIEAQTGHRKLL